MSEFKFDKKQKASRLVSSAQSIAWRIKHDKDYDVPPFIKSARKLLNSLEEDLNLPPEPVFADITMTGMGQMTLPIAMESVDAWGEIIRAVGYPGYGFADREGPEWSKDYSTVTFHCEFPDELALGQAEDELHTEVYNSMTSMTITVKD